MVHIQTGNMLDVVKEGKLIGLKQRDSMHLNYGIIWLPDPKGLLSVLERELRPEPKGFLVTYSQPHGGFRTEFFYKEENARGYAADREHELHVKATITPLYEGD